MKLQVMLVDDHTLFRQALHMSLALSPGIEIVAEAGNAATALALVDITQVNVVCLDVNLPDLSGVEVTRLLMARQPSLKVIGLSAQADMAVVAAMIDAGAAGFVSKISAGQDLPEAIQDISRNQTYFSPVLGINSRDDLATGHAGPDAPARRNGSNDPAGP